MYKIEEQQIGDFPVLTDIENIFHDALKQGHQRYHVINENGDNFDLVFHDNNDIEQLKNNMGFLNTEFYPAYKEYNENDKKTLWLKALSGREKIFIEEINEYTVAVLKVVLNYTDLKIITDDKRINWFFKPNKQIEIVEKLPEYDNKSMFWVKKDFYLGIIIEDLGIWDSTSFFHNIFFLQSLLNGHSLDKLKYVSFDLDETNGIGQILSLLKKFNKAFSYFNLKINISKEKTGSYRTETLNKYFSLGLINDDADESNTLFIDNFSSIYLTHFIFSQKEIIDEKILTKEFQEQLDEYFEGVFKNQKILGVLIRGTDYKINNLGGFMKMAPVDLMIPMINDWLNEGKYDRIFLATEDADILSEMREVYGNKLVAVSQERKKVSDFDEKNKTLNQLYNDETYAEALIEDFFVNYFYALYILSKCDSFICSGWCNGYEIVKDFNGGKFEKIYKFSVGIEKSKEKLNQDD